MWRSLFLNRGVWLVGLSGFFGTEMFTPLAFAQEVLSSGNVVFSNAALADLGREVTCEFSAPLSQLSLIKPGMDPHDFSMRPSDRIRVEKAKVFFHLPQKLESWIPKAPVAAELSVDPKWSDPHVWHSIELSIALANQIRDRLKPLSANPKKLDQCTEAFEKKARVLENKTKTRFSKLPEARRTLAVEHNAISYFADMLGLKVVSLRGVKLSGPLSPNELAEFSAQLKGAAAIFPPNSQRAKVLDAALRESKTKVGKPLIYDGPTTEKQGASGLLKMWQRNADTLWEGLSAP